MTLQAIYFISQVVAAIALIGSLIFVGVQVRQNTAQGKRQEAASRAAAAEAVHDNFAKWYMSTAEHPHLAEVGAKGLRDFDELSDIEAMQFITSLMAVMSYTQSAFYKWRDGDLSDELWQSWEASSLSYFTTPGGRRVWEIRRYVFTEPFVEYVEANLLHRELPTGARPWIKPTDDAAGAASGTAE